ncbi:TlpA disulfide reductase family protein [Hymenobacter sp. YC55]|uniref:TlpA family protein disulfide reductase n=1 Tax=Hymenobacter sp. YC55 TaxID=3034019 RepID=UPI0023F80005|nr:TlpA disulfide reductase family protein [Hymenobacter sp. YC55]MDF7813059.1 TlpA disulfide reductase family protein [Hymenobacter sp. YC55]
MRAIQRLILAILVSAASIASSYAQRKEALIINQSARDEKSIPFYYTDILGKDKSEAVKPGDTLHVAFDENSFDQINVRIAHRSDRILEKKPALLVWPGDVVTVRREEATNTYTFSGEYAAELKFYDRIWHNVINLDPWYESHLGDSLNLPPTLDELMSQWQEGRQLTDELLAELRNTPGVRPMVVAALTRELQLQTFLFLLRGNSYQELYYATSINIPSSLRKYRAPGTVKVFPVVYQDSVLAQFRRLRYLQALPLSVSEHRVSVAQDFLEYLALAQGKAATRSTLYALAKREYTGNQKEWTCYSLLYNAKRIRRPQPHLVRDYRSWMMPESRFVRSLTGQDQLTLVMPDQQLTNTDTLIGPSGQKTTLAQLLAKHRGKVIYLDFWASWCLPCLMEMPASAALRQHYQGKPVTFIYVSIDEDALKWQRATTQHLPKNVEQYRFTSYKTARFVKRFGVTSIPRYILLDKYGIMRYAEAPRPDDPELKTHVATFLAR